MKIIKQSFEMKTVYDGSNILQYIEQIGRLCYKSEDKITPDSAKRFVELLISRGHEAMIEHINITVLFITDRGITHEIVRHRIASYAQESTRYCDYSKNSFGKELTFIEPCYWAHDTFAYKAWKNHCETTDRLYQAMRLAGNSPEESRAILPTSLKTEIVVTMNLREWRHFLRLRTAHTAHPQMRDLVIPLLNHFKETIPIIFNDILI